MSNKYENTREEVMSRSAAKCGVEKEQVQPIVDKLKANFTNDLEDFVEMTDEDWKEVGVVQKPLLNQIKKVIQAM